jgi:hypothetical protein
LAIHSIRLEISLIKTTQNKTKQKGKETINKQRQEAILKKRKENELVSYSRKKRS